MNTWLLISDDHSFKEVKSLGNYYSVSEYSDDILPMRTHISDLINGTGVDTVTELEFNSNLEKVMAEKELREF